MIIRKLLIASALAGVALSPAAVMAQAAQAQPTLRVGATVKDPQGGTVGTITAIEGANLTLRTDRHEVRLPTSSFTATQEGALFAMTQAQLNAAVEQAQAQAAAAFVVGAQVKDSAGAFVGTVQALDAQTVTVQMGAQEVRLPRSSLAGRNGVLVSGATLAQLQAAASSATAASTEATADASAAGGTDGGSSSQ
jgi:hypothetical protein